MASGLSLLKAKDVVMKYAGSTALRGVGLTIDRGTVHGLLGENGAGKSTLVRIIAGLIRPTSGSIYLDDVQIVNADVRYMERNGVFLVSQEPSIVDQLTVADNVLLGRWPAKGVFVDDKKLYAAAERLLADTGMDGRRSAATLNAVERRKLNILRALHSGGKLIILDEPTAALTLADRSHLFDFMNELKLNGVSFMFISHYNEEILEICDRVSVLRDGVMVSHDQRVADLTPNELSSLVVGRDLVQFTRDAVAHQSPAWSIKRIQSPGISVENLEIRAGEVVGFAGMPGSGAREIGRALFGLAPRSSGLLSYKGVESCLPTNPAEAIRRGIAYVSEDRLKDGFIGIQSIRENMVLSSLRSLAKFGFMQSSREQNLLREFMASFSIKAESDAKAVSALSGGNQQKVCLARAIATQPKLLILNEPTRGIDVGVKEEVHRIVDRLTQAGVSLIIVTADIDEMLRIVDRVILFVNGCIVADCPSERITKEHILETAFSSKVGQPLQQMAL